MVWTVDLEIGNRPDVVADARALPFREMFGVVCSDTMINQLGSTLDLALDQMTSLSRRLVLREWLPADGRGNRDLYLQAMLTARQRDGDDYELHSPDDVADRLRSRGWVSDVQVYEEASDDGLPLLYPLHEARHGDLALTVPPTGPGIVSSWVLVAHAPGLRKTPTKHRHVDSEDRFAGGQRWTASDRA